MNNKAKAVLWIGLILIATQVGALWPQIRGFIFTPGPGSSPGGGGTIPLFPWPLNIGVLSAQTPARHRAKA